VLVPAATGAGGQADAATPKADVLIYGGSEVREDVMDGGNLLALWGPRRADERERKCLRCECWPRQPGVRALQISAGTFLVHCGAKT
jgi:hypothetical protein